MTFSGLLVIAALFLAPPGLLAIGGLRRALRRRARREPRSNWMPPAILAAVGALALVVNLVIVAHDRSGTAPGAALNLTAADAVGATIAWLCFWAWVLTGLMRPRRRKRSAA